MSRNSSGTYTLPAGNPVVTGTLIESSWANSTLSDIASALTDSLSRSGQGSMTAALRLADGTSTAPGLAWASETNTGLYRYGSADTRFLVTGIEIQKWLATGAKITGTFEATGNTTIGGTLGVTGATTLTGALTVNGGIANNPTLSAGTANGVAYLNGSKVLTTGSALTFDGTNLGLGGTVTSSVNGYGFKISNSSGNNGYFQATNGTQNILFGISSGNLPLIGALSSDPVAFYAAGSEQMRLTSTGLGIGTSSPSTKLTVESAASNTTVRVYSALSGSLFYSGYEVARAGVTGGALMRAARNASIGGVGWEWLTTADNGAELSGTYTSRMLLDSSGNLGLGVTPSAWGASYKAVELPGGVALTAYSTVGDMQLFANAYSDGGSYRYKTSTYASNYEQYQGKHIWYTAPSGTAGNAISFTQAMTLDANGNLLVGTTSQNSNERLSVVAPGSNQALYTKNNSTDYNFNCWNAATTGNNPFIQFITETAATSRGSITYNRAAGLVSFNTTSDYRAKDITGPIQDSGSVIDSVPVYMGKMKGATQERPMFIAHETPSYAHTGEKDAVDADGNPVYQQMDASALVPVMWAEIQSLRARVAQLEGK